MYTVKNIFKLEFKEMTQITLERFEFIKSREIIVEVNDTFTKQKIMNMGGTKGSLLPPNLF